MKRPLPNIARNVETGKETNLDELIPPQVYTSVADWKPVTPEQFVHLLHGYSTEDKSLDDFNHGLMTATSLILDPTTNCTIWYVPKEVDSPVSSPVLMTMNTVGSNKVVCFASTKYGSQRNLQEAVPLA